MAKRRSTETFKVVVVYSPSPDADQRLARVVAVLRRAAAKVAPIDAAKKGDKESV